MEIILIRGGGDLATGLVQKFFRAGFRVLVLETNSPTAIRRSVSVCEAVHTGLARVEDVVCRRVSDTGALGACWDCGEVPLLIDPAGTCIRELRPAAVVDAIMAKRNLGTNRDMAPVTVALGPGFRAGTDVNAVIETQRGHDLGRVILDGRAKENTGIPGEIGGKSAQRVLHAPAAGIVTHFKKIGDLVRDGEALFSVGGETVRAPFDGLLRGLIREGLQVPTGMKAADLDPRTDVDWRTISDKARCLGGAALEAFLMLRRR